MRAAAGPSAFNASLSRSTNIETLRKSRTLSGELKRAVLAVPFEEADPQAAALLVAIFEKSLAYLEMELTDTLLAPGAARKGEVRDKPDLLARAREIGAGAAGWASGSQG